MSFVHEFVLGQSPWTLLLLHGTGGDERDLLPLGRELSPEASLLSPLGKVLEGTAPRFFRRVSEGVFDVDDLIFRTNELADWLLDQQREREIDPERMLAIGYSNGATIVSSLIMLRPDVLRGGVALRPSLPYEPASMPDLHGKDVLYLPGEFDTVVPSSQADRLVELMLKAGARAESKLLRASHGLTQEDVAFAREWVGLLTANR